MPTRTFNYTGDWQRWEVPKDVEYVTVTVEGAGSDGRRGGRVSGRIRVNEKQTLFIQVGQEGRANKGASGGGIAWGGGGAGGDGKNNPGGFGGGGASAIRINSRTGTVKAVAGGAGGSSGDGGKGGRGGSKVGEAGSPGNAAGSIGRIDLGDGKYDYTTVGNATGGTQTQGGNKGTSSAGSSYNGHSASDGTLARGGQGGGPGTARTYGGGGGGGGWRAGGGGQAALIDETPGGGGGGGSNYVGGLIGYTNEQGTGNANNGQVTLTWVSPPPANQPPNPPTEVHIKGGGDWKDAPTGSSAQAIATESTGEVRISAKLSDPDKEYDKDGKPIGPQDRVRLVARFSPASDFSRNVRTEDSDLVEQANDLKGKKRETGRASVTLRGLSQNTQYHVRLYAKDSRGKLSTNYTSLSFWTNRFPTEPDLRYPADNASVSEISSVVFEWAHRDPDPNSSQREYEIRWRRAKTAILPHGEWKVRGFRSSFNQYVADPFSFTSNAFHEWTVRTMDAQGKWSPWAHPRTFFVTGQSAPPTPLEPIRDEAADVSKPVTFKWRFRDPDPGDSQAKADLRYRPVGTNDWFQLSGSESEPGGAEQWTLPVATLMPGTHYEWQVRTQDTINSAVSEWSESAYFWSTATPGVGITRLVVPTRTEVLGELGCGENRAFIYDRGGKVLRGEITPTTLIRWGRQRDDIANCIVDTNGFGEDCGDLLRSIHCWLHELVIFRDGVRVFEGPITRITDSQDGVELEAKDVMGYVYRRIMRQGYNDAYRVVNGEQLGQSTVVERATRIVMNALAPDDPNLLQYLTSLNFPDDAQTSRIVPDFSKTAWEEIDDLAATSGLDYVTVGRRIVLWDTHRPLGRLPEMRDHNFSDPPIVSEYGMQLATHFGVTNNNGVWGLASRDHSAYGLIEQLASAYGESEAGAADETLTSEARASLQETLRKQAERNIAGRWPTPLIVRVPDNSTLSPDTNVTINQLVPGVWIPLRASGTIREVAQWQKLDLMTVEQTEKGEKITVTMSPAPNHGEDPDADASVVSE